MSVVVIGPAVALAILVMALGGAKKAQQMLILLWA
jgi:hypothetical protein